MLTATLTEPKANQNGATTPHLPQQTTKKMTMKDATAIASRTMAAAKAATNCICGQQQKLFQHQPQQSFEMFKRVWKNADAVCFDVDSTVCRDEAIDELAKFAGKSEEVSNITKHAMVGNSDFRIALAQRLAIIKPSKQIIENFLATHKPKLTPHIAELVSLLHSRNVAVYLVSGGFDIIIQAAAKQLNIPHANIFANSILHNSDGSYAGFDVKRPTSTQDGKPRVVASLKQLYGYKNVVMIGDGVTDMQACPPADAFIGFGGNQIRESVKNNSVWFVYSFKELIAELS